MSLSPSPLLWWDKTYHRYLSLPPSLAASHSAPLGSHGVCVQNKSVNNKCPRTAPEFVPKHVAAPMHDKKTPKKQESQVFPPLFCAWVHVCICMNVPSCVVCVCVCPCWYARSSQSPQRCIRGVLPCCCHCGSSAGGDTTQVSLQGKNILPTQARSTWMRIFFYIYIIFSSKFSRVLGPQKCCIFNDCQAPDDMLYCKLWKCVDVHNGYRLQKEAFNYFALCFF